MTNDEKLLNLFILVDRTGSMQTNWRNTIATLNEYMGSLSNINVSINLAFFDKTSHNGYNSGIRLWNAVPQAKEEIVQRKYIKAKNWTPVSEYDETIKPRGMTPLYDAICTYVKDAKIQGLKKSDLVQFVIITDGDENNSTEYTLTDAKAVLAKLEKKGWPVQYLGANLEAFSGGAKVVSDFGKLAQYNTNKWQETSRSLVGSSERYYATASADAASFTDFELKDMKD